MSSSTTNEQNQEVAPSISAPSGDARLSQDEARDDEQPTEANSIGMRIRSGLGRSKRLIATTGIAFSVVGVQLIQGMLLARMLGPEGRGQYATTILYVQVLMFMGLLGGAEVICRLATRMPERIKELRRLSRKTAIMTGVGTFGLVVVLDLLLVPKTNGLVWLSLICATSMIAHHFVIYSLFVERGVSNFRRYNILNFLSAALFPAFLLGLWLFSEVTLAKACIAYVLAIYIAALGTFVTRRSSGQALATESPQAQTEDVAQSTNESPYSPPKSDTTPALAETVGNASNEQLPGPFQVLKQGRPYAAAMLLVDMFERLDLLLMAWLASFQDFGYFTAMIPTAYPLTVAPNTLGIFLFNKGAQSDGSLTPAAFKKSLSLMIGFQVFSIVGFMLCIGLAVRIVYGEEFVPAVYFAYWLAPISAIKGMLLLLNSYLSGRGRPLAQTRSRIAALVITLVVVPIAYPFIGIYAVPLGSLCAASVCFVWLLAVSFAEVRSHAEATDSIPDPSST